MTLTKQNLVLVFLISTLFAFSAKANTNVKLISGAGNIEHFSTGIGVEFCSNHYISVLFGSNFFVKPKSFSTYLLQYEYVFKRLNTLPIAFNAGISGGYTIYSNTFYRWELVALVLHSGVSYALNEKLKLKLNCGAAFSRGISIERINYGEIGWYKELLPEFKLELNYVIF